MNTKLSTALLLCAGVTACATVAPPPDLVDARRSLKEANASPAARHNLAGLDTAKKALTRAEKSFADDGDTRSTRDLAYAADRQAQIAQAYGSAKMFGKQQVETQDAMHAAETAKVHETSKSLVSANQRLELQGQEIKSERERREQAEARLKQATADLAKFASIKQETRGVVITLSGNVLFASAKSELFAGAEVKLNSVAEMLTQQDPDSKIVVEGHTDSQGSDAYNQKLSERRAETVRSYLVGRGIASDRITAEGFGSTNSIANNDSAEGRANNRRVEIVVQPVALTRSR